MVVKKNPKANLESIRGSLLLLGVVVSLILVFVLFGASKTNVKVDELYGNIVKQSDEEMIAITKPKTPKAPPVVKNLTTEIEIVKNDIKIKDSFNLPDDIEDTVLIDFDLIFDLDDGIDKKGEPLFTADVMPIFPGGEKGMNQFIINNYVYPEQAIENDIEGTVYVRFVVSKTGKVTQVMAANKVDPLLEEEAIRVVKTFPNFSPGIQNGRNVEVWMTVPFEFVLLK